MSDWWSRKMGAPTTAAPRESTPPPTYTAHTPANTHVDSATLPTARKAPHERASGSCPDCNSGNYFSMNGGRARCYDCGYPIVQSTSGVRSVSNEGGKPTPAVQVHGTSNFNPGQIIGRVG